jgi:hypothetical protein
MGGVVDVLSMDKEELRYTTGVDNTKLLVVREEILKLSRHDGGMVLP